MNGWTRLSPVVACAGIAVLVTAGATAGRTIAPRPVAPPALALGFVENRGQTDARVRYYTRGDGYAVYLTRDEVMLALAKQPHQLALALRFVGRSPLAAPVGAKPGPGTVNYLRGSDPATWQTGLRQYGRVVYPNLWPRIDLRVSPKAGVLKYEFRVRPGARVSDIRLAYAGAKSLGLDAAGRLVI